MYVFFCSLLLFLKYDSCSFTSFWLHSRFCNGCVFQHFRVCHLNARGGDNFYICSELFQTNCSASHNLYSNYIIYTSKSRKFCFFWRSHSYRLIVLEIQAFKWQVVQPVLFSSDSLHLKLSSVPFSEQLNFIYCYFCLHPHKHVYFSLCILASHLRDANRWTLLLFHPAPTSGDYNFTS